MGDTLEISYDNVLRDTIEETYPKYLQNKMIKDLEKEGLIYFKENLFIDENSVDLSTVEEEDRLITAVTQNRKIRKTIEKFEFINSYKYSALFDITGFDEHVLNRMTKANYIKEFETHEEKDHLFLESEEEAIPSLLKFDSEIYVFKFNKLLKGYKAVDGDNERHVKYPILGIIHKDLNVLEVRFEKVRGFLKNNDDFFYVKQVYLVKSWFQRKLRLKVNPIILSPVVEFILKQDTKDVNVSAQAMTLKSGKKAVLDVGGDDQEVLPLLGELKELIKSNQELFDANEDIYKLIKDFILETEETSDLPWISLSWKGEAKDSTTKVKFNFNYMGQDFTVLQYYGNKSEMERMNNVTRYIIQNKIRYEEQAE